MRHHRRLPRWRDPSFFAFTSQPSRARSPRSNFHAHPRPRVREIARHYPHSASPRAVPVPAAPARVRSRVLRPTRAFRARASLRAFPRRARARVRRGRRAARERAAYSIARELFGGDRSSSSSSSRVVASRRIASDAPDDSNARAPARPHDRASSTAVTSRVSKDVFDDAHEPAARRPLFDYLVFAAARQKDEATTYSYKCALKRRRRRVPSGGGDDRPSRARGRARRAANERGQVFGDARGGALGRRARELSRDDARAFGGSRVDGDAHEHSRDASSV